jgi:hypothetical protein
MSGVFLPREAGEGDRAERGGGGLNRVGVAKDGRR